MSPDHSQHEGLAYSEPGHEGHSHGKDASTTRLVLAIVFNAAITAAEVVAGIVAGSLTLLADAAHNASDTASMGVSLVARHVTGREPDRRRTFGYERAELIGAFINLVTLVVIALYLLVEAGQRFLEPHTIDGQLMLIVGVITLVGNVLTALVLYKPSKGSLNIESAFVHIVADALGSVAVILGGWLIASHGWTIVDPILTAAIAVYILVHSYEMLRETISILMESAPRDFPLDEMMRALEATNHVCDVHHVHVWRLNEDETALEAHVKVEEIDALDTLDALKRDLKQTLRAEYGIGHATLEIEYSACTDESGGERAPAQASRASPAAL